MPLFTNSFLSTFTFLITVFTPYLISNLNLINMDLKAGKVYQIKSALKNI